MKYMKLGLILILLWANVLLLCQIDINNLKAAYSAKFTTFIEWPVAENKENFVIGYFQENQYIKVLKEYLKDSKIKNLPVLFLKIHSYELIPQCDMICLCEPDNEKKQVLLDYIKDHPILTITHYRKGALDGFHINFFIENEKLKFEINTQAAKQSGFKISYHLLTLAKIVSEKG